MHYVMHYAMHYVMHYVHLLDELLEEPVVAAVRVRDQHERVRRREGHHSREELAPPTNIVTCAT